MEVNKTIDIYNFENELSFFFEVGNNDMLGYSGLPWSGEQQKVWGVYSKGE